MDATGKNLNPPLRNVAGCKIKNLRKDKHDLQKDRQNVKNSKLLKHILCVEPYLESLPDKLLHNPAKDFAMNILSTAIERKHHLEILNKSTENPSTIPNSALFKFTLGGSKNISNSEEFKKLEAETSEKLNEFRLYRKSQIMKAQELELKKSNEKLRKEIICESLKLSNYLTDYYKVILDEGQFYNTTSSTPFNRKLLSQAAVIMLFKLLKTNKPSITNELVIYQDIKQLPIHEQHINLEHKHDDYDFM